MFSAKTIRRIGLDSPGVVNDVTTVPRGNPVRRTSERDPKRIMSHVAVKVARGVVRRRLRAPALLVPILIPLRLLHRGRLAYPLWPDYLQHARTSLDRLIMVTAPFGTLVRVRAARSL